MKKWLKIFIKIGGIIMGILILLTVLLIISILIFWNYQRYIGENCDKGYYNGFFGIYYRDKQDRFDFNDIDIKDADIWSFQVIDHDITRNDTGFERCYIGLHKKSSRDYAKDKNHVYFKDKIITWADPETFVVVDEEGFFWKDKNHVYRRGWGVLDKLDPVSTVFHKNLTYYEGKRDIGSIYSFIGDENNCYAVTEVEHLQQELVMQPQNICKATFGN